MNLVTAHLQSVSSYSQSRYLVEKKQPNEDYEDYEKRVWRDRAHTVLSGPDKGKVFIPPAAIKQAIDSAAKYLSIQVPGKGKTTYTKHFVSGVMCVKPIVLPITREDLDYFAGPMSAKGEKGKAGGSVVVRMYPMIHEWAGEVELHIFDNVITKDVLRQVLETAGLNIGIGRYRPQNGGYNGRFEVTSIDWS